MVGLGNPGDRYTGTRHNVGFDVVEAFARRVEGDRPRIDRLECRALTGRVRLGDRPILLAKPQTFMNESGQSVKGLAVKYGVPLDRLMVVLDENALPLGSIRLRRGGSSAGHQGLQNVLDCLGTESVPRLRIGIRGRTLPPGGELPEYVLSRFSKAERPVIDAAVGLAAEALETYVLEGIDAAMNRFNRSPEEEPES